MPGKRSPEDVGNSGTAPSGHTPDDIVEQLERRIALSHSNRYEVAALAEILRLRKAASS